MRKIVVIVVLGGLGVAALALTFYEWLREKKLRRFERNVSWREPPTYKFKTIQTSGFVREPNKLAR